MTNRIKHLTDRLESWGVKSKLANRKSQIIPPTSPDWRERMKRRAAELKRRQKPDV